jgi:hypothetical protein
MSFLALLLATATDAWAACPASPADVDAGLQRARAAYLDDADTFAPVADQVLAMARCANGPLMPESVVELHAIAAMQAFVQRDTPRVFAAIAGAKATDPAFMPGEDVAPAGSSLRRAFEGAPQPATLTPLPTVKDRRWRVDGKADPLAAIPAGRAVYIQQQATSGAIVASWYLPQGGGLSDVGAASPPAASQAAAIVAPAVAKAQEAVQQVRETVAAVTEPSPARTREPAPPPAAKDGSAPAPAPETAPTPRRPRRAARTAVLATSSALLLAGGGTIAFTLKRDGDLDLDACATDPGCTYTADQVDALKGVGSTLRLAGIGAAVLGVGGIATSAILLQDGASPLLAVPTLQ